MHIEAMSNLDRSDNFDRESCSFLAFKKKRPTDIASYIEKRGFKRTNGRTDTPTRSLDDKNER